jgi:photosystem II stability/assembly factor-like uncharacterized protein
MQCIFDGHWLRMQEIAGIILYTSNGGANWTSAALNNGHALRSITFVNQNTSFTAGDHGGLYKPQTE